MNPKCIRHECLSKNYDDFDTLKRNDNRDAAYAYNNI